MTREAAAVSVYNESKQTLLATRVVVANTGLSRLIGLLGKRSLQANTGIWIIPANAVHTFGMLFRFDLVLIDRTHKVVGLRERIAPFLMTWPNFRARSVLELPAHTISNSRTAVGDQLRLDSI